jgi:antitoxin ParD1/3/4
MTQFQINLPDDAANYVNALVAEGKFSSPSDVVADALAAKRVQAAREHLSDLIREGIESGDTVEVTDEWWNNLDRKVEAELQRRQSA